LRRGERRGEGGEGEGEEMGESRRNNEL